MTAPITGIGGMGGAVGPRRIGLDIAGVGGMSRFQMPEGGTSFGDTIKKAIGGVSEKQDTAQNYIERFVRGEPVELHQVMAASEEAQLSLEMLVEMRNKLMDAYKSVVTMG
jgi:flagellar hook-basal body complex protein FliE